MSMTMRPTPASILLVCLVCLGAPAATLAKYGGCTNGITCRKVTANNLTFDCRFGGDALRDRPGVMMLHGFPEWSDMYMDLMRDFAAAGYRTVACNQRGYSPGASPPHVADYNYDLLADDVLAVAAATNISAGTARFHLVGHDHGAALGWTVAAGARGAASLLSYSSLSIPHLDAFSRGLVGPDASLDQVMASQYFTMFVLNNSATLHGSFLWYSMGDTSGDANSGSFPNPAAFQKALWWYNGARDAGRMAIPRIMGAGELLSRGAFAAAALRAVFGGTPQARGEPAARPVGNVSVPSLYVCGTGDSAILCDKPYALKTKDYCTGGYRFLAVDCGHELLACASGASTAKVKAAVLAHVKAASGGG